MKVQKIYTCWKFCCNFHKNVGDQNAVWLSLTCSHKHQSILFIFVPFKANFVSYMKCLIFSIIFIRSQQCKASDVIQRKICHSWDAIYRITQCLSSVTFLIPQHFFLFYIRTESKYLAIFQLICFCYIFCTVNYDCNDVLAFHFAKSPFCTFLYSYKN